MQSCAAAKRMQYVDGSLQNLRWYTVVWRPSARQFFNVRDDQ